MRSGFADDRRRGVEHIAFVHTGPVFREPMSIARGEVTSRPPFVFCDLFPARGVRTG